MSPHKDYERVELRTGINPAFLAETLTTDIELVDALYDMIDNSIDAARNVIVSKDGYETDEYSLPKNYAGYEIALRISPRKIVIVDNCLGIDSEIVENKTFYTGDRSSHKFGIGHYGLGLKRALLKAGESFGFMTDNGRSRYKSKFTHAQLSDSDVPLYGEKYKSKGGRKTIFVCSHLKKDAVDQLKSKEWFESAFSELCLRYSEFLKKGLKIRVSYRASGMCTTQIAVPKLPQFRPSFPFAPKSSSILTKSTQGKVVANYSVGIHEDYRFPGEYENTGQKHNSEYTQWYGIYILCNDRVIVAHSFERKHGFNARFHSEYNGCICVVKINAEDPSLLPWNTAKTEIKVRSELFLEIKSEIEPLTSWYRSKTKKIINTWKRVKKESEDKEEWKRLLYLAMGWPALSVESQSPAFENQMARDDEMDVEEGLDDEEVQPQTVPEEDEADQQLEEQEEINNEDSSRPDRNQLAKFAKPERSIPASSAVIEKLRDLDSKKISSLYHSLTMIRLVRHPVMMYVGAWSFWESLCSLAGMSSNSDFPGFLGSKINVWFQDRNQKSTFRSVLQEINSKGNANKHHGIKYQSDASQLAIDFRTLEPVLLKLIDLAIEAQSNSR